MKAATLYRFFAADGQLLYVGITGELPVRLTTHNRQQDWWRQVVRVTLEHFDSRQAARMAEVAAIRDERPRHNRWQGERRAIPPEVVAALRAVAEQQRRDWRAGPVRAELR